MDEVTQHNAALVEESAATANSLADQARQLSELTAAFKVASDAALREAAV
jgi:methyl-accepting chemotaxis protein-1 (serine sensor receptor)